MPLAHLLIPQLAKKAEEIEAALGHRPEQIGYLQASATPSKADAAPGANQAFQSGAARGYAREKGVQDRKLIPNAPSPRQPRYYPQPLHPMHGAPVGMNEDGTPIPGTDHVPKPVKKGKRTIIQLPQGEPVGHTESGIQIGAGPKRLGYLGRRAPADPNMQTLERRSKDVPVFALDKRTGRPANPNQITYDQFGVQLLQREFGKHLKEMQENRAPNAGPTDKFPPGYFEGMSAARRLEIEQGVKRLQEIERGVST